MSQSIPPALSKVCCADSTMAEDYRAPNTASSSSGTATSSCW
jgi:hypothetical protein